MQVFYNKVNATEAPLTQATLKSLTTTALYNYSTVCEDINSIATTLGLRSWLLPGDPDASTAAVAGYALTHVRSLYTFSAAFNVSIGLRETCVHVVPDSCTMDVLRCAH